MAEQPTSVAREAKSIHQSLKELLKTKEPFDREVDFQRKNLRRRYLNLLLVHPDARESKDVENHLWMQTSYAFISSYKQRIATLDRAIQSHARNQQQQDPPQPRQSHHGVVEHRKLVQRFRQFLADEEKFWTQLVLRLRRLFDLGEAQPALVALGLDVEDMRLPTEAADSRDGVMHGATGRNHHQFPPEDPSSSFAPSSPEERKSRLAIVSKALICLGDIARYRELYNESNPKRAGQEDGRRGRNRRGGAVDMAPRPKNYAKAQQCYEQARLLVPYEGNPSHQLAILASYKKDSFASLIHYYRALCAIQPYETAAENLGTVLTKALETWNKKTRREKGRNAASDSQPPSIRQRIESFQENIVVLHALWRVGTDNGIDKMKLMSPKHSDQVAQEFYFLVAGRHLPIDMISNTIVLAQGALWKHRMIRPTSASHSRNHQTNAAPPGTATIIEWALVDHLMDLHVVLLEVGKEELKDPSGMDGSDDIAQRISAVFRRTLPALRIASKWLLANFKYVLQDPEFLAYQEKEKSRGAEAVKASPHKISGNSEKTLHFWKTYSQFVLALSKAFPSSKLPLFDAPLEEDIDMRGFWPLKKLMGEPRQNENGDKSTNGARAREQVHPNVEQLMRIADLLDDAKILANKENSPLRIINTKIMFDPEAVETIGSIPDTPEEPPLIAEDPPALKPENIVRPEPDLDNMSEHTSRTDDDPVRDAFKFLDDTSDDIMDEDDEDEEIVWNPRGSVSPAVSPTLQVIPVTPIKPTLTPKALSPKSPTYYRPVNPSSFNAPIAPPQPAATTAEDLLNDMTRFPPRASGSLLPPHLEPTSTAPQPKFLFGSNLTDRPGQSIWSTSRDEASLMYPANGGNTSNVHPNGHMYQTSPREFSTALSPLQDLSQSSIWNSSYQSQSQNSQQNLVGALPSASFAQPPQMMLPSSSVNLRHQQQQHHHRMPSSPIAAQQYSNYNQAPHDPFSYAPSIQPPIHRPEQGFSSSSSGFPNSSHPLAALGGHGSGMPAQFYPSVPSGYHSRQASMHDPRVTQQSYMSPPMSQIWGNPG